MTSPRQRALRTRDASTVGRVTIPEPQSSRDRNAWVSYRVTHIRGPLAPVGVSLAIIGISLAIEDTMDVILELFSFRGRANRWWYFWHTLLDGIVVLGLIAMVVTLAGIVGVVPMIVPFLGIVVAAVVTQIAIAVKRLHDLDRPGRHWWLLVIPIYNIYFALVLLFRTGTMGPNRFGPDPLRSPAPVDYLEG